MTPDSHADSMASVPSHQNTRPMPPPPTRSDELTELGEAVKLKTLLQVLSHL